MLHDRRILRPTNQTDKGAPVNILKSAAIVAVGLVALAGCKPAAVDTSAAETEIKAASRAWVTAYSAGDAEAVAALYTADAELMPPGAPTAVGHDAIRDFIASDSAATKAAGMAFALNDDDKVIISGDLAVHSGSFVVTDASGATVDTGMYMEAVQKKDGKWLMARDTWNSNKAPAPAPAAMPAS